MSGGGKWMKRVRKTAEVLGFIVLFLFLYSRISYILCCKMGKNDTINSFYKEPRDTIDVLFVGSSHAYSSFSPMEYWKASGIASYNLGSSSQSFPCSYYLLKEGIRTQHPKLVVLEAYGAKYDTDYASLARLHIALDGIPYNQTKAEIFSDFLPRTMDFHERLEFIFPIIRFHTRWNQLSAADYRPQDLCLKGYHLSCKITPVTEPDTEAGSQPVYDGAMEYFQKIVDLCRENDVDLLLCQTPMGMNGKYTLTNQRVNTLMEYAKAQGIPCINFEDKELRAKTGLDYDTDFRDDEHLNLYGMRKTAAYLLDYFEENYDLPNHQNEKNYEAWKDDYEKYESLVAAKEKKPVSGNSDED